MQKNVLLSVLAVAVALSLSGCGKPTTPATSIVPTKPGDTTWQYTKSIPTPLTTTSSLDQDVTVGSVTEYKAAITISKGAFDTPTTITVSNPDSVPEFVGSEVVMLDAPVEISVGEPTRLNEKATITLPFDQSALLENGSTANIRIAYFDGTGWRYIKPTSIDKEKRTITFDTYHFSLFGKTKIKDDAVITEQWVHSKTLDKTLVDMTNTTTDKIAEQIIDMTLKKMGFKDESVTKAILADVLKDDGYKEIYDAYQDGQVIDVTQKIAILAGKKIAEGVDESAMKEALGNVVEGAEDVAAVAQAAGFIAEGQYKDAARLIGETIADKFILTTAGKVAVEVVQGQIDSWKNNEVEAAYNAYLMGSNKVFYGYYNDKGDFDTVWDQMRGIRRQLELEAIKAENEVRRESGLPDLTEAQMDRIRETLKDSYKKQFADRAKQEAEMAEEARKLKLLVESWKSANFFDSTYGPVGLDKGFDYENKLDVLYHFAQKMMKDTKRFDLTEKTGLLVDKKLSIEDITQAARYYFSGPDGKKAYAKFLKDRFNISMYPDLADLKGNWPGTLTITDVVGVPPMDKSKPASSDPLETGCDLGIDLNELKGQTVPLTLTITPSGDAAGTLGFVTEDSEDSKSTPFTYEEGVIKATISDKGATGVFALTATEDDVNYSLNGSLTISLGEAGKIIATVSGTKPVKVTPPAPATKKP